MFSLNDINKASEMFNNGAMPSDILRYFIINDTNQTIPDLMKLMRDSFNLEYEDTQCIGGWWHDGSGELSDIQIDKHILKSILQRNSNDSRESRCKNVADKY